MVKKAKPTIKKIIIEKRKIEPSLPAGSCPYCGREHRPLAEGTFLCNAHIHLTLLNEAETRTYRKAAIATIRKLRVINDEPIVKALADLRRWEIYLARENNLKEEDIR